jgi:hypothetical protein
MNVVLILSSVVAKKPPPPPPKYLKKKDYGVTPTYIVKRNEEEKGRHEHELEEKHDEIGDEGLVMLPEKERLSILEGLKKNWQKLNSDYQKLSLTVDTVPKIARYYIISYPVIRCD